METVSDIKMFGGRQIQFTHSAKTVDCEMHASIYLPPNSVTEKVPALYWLSGLTCTDQNFVTKAGAQRVAAKLGIAIVCPDTSPRGENVPDDANGAWDFGLGAGFYVNATQAPWKKNYKMFDYIRKELPNVIESQFNVDSSRKSIFGHSMGGHGALIIALNNVNAYRSVSAFSPIVSPMNCSWGNKALSHYIGTDRDEWPQYDACSLVRNATHHLPILVDQGGEDNFLEDQLKTQLLEQASQEANYPITIRYQEGYDHSYYFISSFISEHLAFHYKHLSV